MSDSIPVRVALVSVSDKTDLIPFCRKIAANGTKIVSTGGTARALAEADIEVTSIESVTGFPEMMDGRVKTLHPKVHGGLLALRDKPDHAQAMNDHEIEAIDLVCINLYPFEQTVADPDVIVEDAIEQIDIGGPSMIRSAAKNHAYVACVTDPSQYDTVVNTLDQNDGQTTLSLRRQLAIDAFGKTAKYDTAIHDWLTHHLPTGTEQET